MVFFPIIGAMSAFDSLLSQAFGAADHTAYGEWLITGVYSTIGLLIPTLILVLCTEQALLLIGIDPEIAELAQIFNTLSIPGVPFLYGFNVLTKYLQCQHIMSPMMWVGAVGNILNFVLDYTIIFHMNQGLEGAAIATAISRMFQFFLVLMFLIYSEGHKSYWPKHVFRRPRFQDIRLFVGLALSGALMVSLEAWSFELATIFAGKLGALSLDAHSVVLSTIAFNFVGFLYPVSIAAGIRVGNKIGEGAPLAARFAAKVSLVSITAVTTVLSLLLISLRHKIPQIYTSDPEVVELASHLLVIASLFQFGDGLQATAAGALRGLGKLNLASGMNFVGFWILGVPVGASLTFGKQHLGVAGLWWGFASGLLCTAFLGVSLICCGLKWEKMGALARTLTAVPLQEVVGDSIVEGESAPTEEVSEIEMTGVASHSGTTMQVNIATEGGLDPQDEFDVLEEEDDVEDSRSRRRREGERAKLFVK
eukprot:c20816_g2_i3.p1 GENE.c20816_g2_i3~~c20816_g2_i3.p1  ORF type:complete len:479 (+),score=124.40 c20816_g2_i3:458-1894(+)